MKIAIHAVHFRQWMVGAMMPRLLGVVVYQDEDCRESLWNMARILAASPAGVLLVRDDAFGVSLVYPRSSGVQAPDALMGHFMKDQ